MLQLGSVRLVRKADDVAAAVDQADFVILPVAELLNRADVETLLDLMANVRYRNIIRLLYLEQKSHKETAEALGMSMDNYYNKRILAEKQFKQVCRKEARHA